MKANTCYFCNKKLDVACPVYMQNPVTRLYTTIYICKACYEEYWYGNMFDVRVKIRMLVYGAAR